MPSRGSYQISNVKEGEAAQRDQSYRSCVITLLIFLFLCIIFMLIAIPLSTYRNYKAKEDYDSMETAQHHHGQHEEHQTEKTTSTTPSLKYYINHETSMEDSQEIETTTLETDVITERSNNTKNFTMFEKILSVVTTSEEPSTSTEIDGTTVAEKISFDYTTTSSISPTTDDISMITTTTESMQTMIDNESIFTTEDSLSKSSIKEETTSTSLYNESTTEFSKKFTTIKEEDTTIETVADSTSEMISRFSPVDDKTSNDPATMTSDFSIDERVCTAGECKNMASKMLFYMNHTVDPCEDFYEYACGGFEASPETVEHDLEDMAYQRIYKQMEKESYGDKSSVFAKYYNSCLEYEHVKYAERIELARGILGEVGKFYTADEWAINPTNFTELLAKLLLRNSALLFDVAPDLDEYSPKQFTLRIGPTTYDNPFDIDHEDDPCRASQAEREQEVVDLEKLYTEYKMCKNDTQTFVRSISEALSELGVFKELNSPFIAQHINITCINIDLEIVQRFFTNFPSTDKIREAYLMKNYTRLTIEELERKFKVVNWTQLIRLLTNELVKPELMVQVYFYDALAKGLENLYDFSERDPILLNNALLALYARNLYQELVLSNHDDARKHCLHIATKVLIPETSNLYVSSFSNEELMYMKDTIRNAFGDLKETLKLKVENAEWATQEERDALIAKINALKVAVPDISYFGDVRSTYRKDQTNEVNLTDNYLVNSVRLMKRYRKLIYAELYTNPGDPEQIWTHYATPYQSKGLAIYGLNLVVIPFGVIDWSMKYDDLRFRYIIMGTLGNVIAHQIAHHFDANGIYYWNGTRDDKNSVLNDNDSTNMNFKEYINNQRNVFYQNSMSMTLLSTGQNILYEISQLTLNERLSETMGLRLAYDTLDRLRSSEEVHLPWFKRDFDQLFYLTYAQTHCTKSPLTSSYISLYENERLPSRIHIFISASNNRLLGEAWNCPEGSQIMPSYTCNPFPYLDCNEATQVTMMRK